MADGDPSPPHRLRDAGDHVVDALNRVRFPFGRRTRPDGLLIGFNVLAAAPGWILAIRYRHGTLMTSFWLGLAILMTLELGLNAWEWQRDRRPIAR